jgi:hypothetical protein
MQKDITKQEIDYLVALADRYDELGLHDYADRVYQYLKTFMDSLPSDVKLRTTHNSDPVAKMNMSQYEAGQGAIYLKGNPQAYNTGKGQQAFKDNAGLGHGFM